MRASQEKTNKLKILRSKRKIILLTSLAFISGMFTHSRLYARAQKIPAQIPPKIVWTGKASWYSRRSPGINKHTANNEVFNDRDYTAAMWGVPFNQMVRVTNRDNGRSVIVRINDRGPHKRLVRKGRMIDLSRQAFSEIAPHKKGLIDIHLELL